MNPDKERALDQVGHHSRGDLERDAVAIEVLDEVVDEYLILMEMCPHAFRRWFAHQIVRIRLARVLNRRGLSALVLQPGPELVPVELI